MPAPSKSAAVIRLLSRAKGATVAELMTATDWQKHSVRAYFSGLRKKCHSLAREQRNGGEQAYRIVAATEPVLAEPVQKSGLARGGIAFGRGSLLHLFGNRVYIGETRHRDAHHPGEHEAILPQGYGTPCRRSGWETVSFAPLSATSLIRVCSLV